MMHCTDDGCKITFCKTCIHYTEMITTKDWVCANIHSDHYARSMGESDGTDCVDWEGVEVEE